MACTILRKANFRECDLRGVDMAECDPSQADLRGVNLRGANTSGAQLQNAQIEGACLAQIGHWIANANLSNVNFRGATVVDERTHHARPSRAPAPNILRCPSMASLWSKQPYVHPLLMKRRRVQCNLSTTTGDKDDLYALTDLNHSYTI